MTGRSLQGSRRNSPRRPTRLPPAPLCSTSSRGTPLRGLQLGWSLPTASRASSTSGSQKPRGVTRVTAAATLALVFDGSATPVAARLALDLSEPHSSYFRPAIRERCRDGFLPLASPGPSPVGDETIVTRVNGREVHRWSLERLARPIDVLVRDVAEFMTLAGGDLLLVGLPGNAPQAKAGDRVEVSCEGFPALECTLVAEEVA